ncbi:MAG TPA: hypothetical protein VIG62_25365 [Blastocatellia bacterium]
MALIRSFILSLVVLAAAAVTFAQSDQAAKPAAPPQATVIVSLSDKGVRFAALGQIGKMRLEVFNSAGDSLFNSEFLPGNIRDWTLEDKLGQPLPDGSYLCVVTLRDLSGRLSLKQGTVLVQGGRASLQLGDSGHATQLEQEKVLSPVSDGKDSAATITAHDGTDGQVISTQGALTFRLGDFFSGKDSEQMRLTPEGNLGIGLLKPQVRLDVEGLIRSTRGIVFPDGSVQYSAATNTFSYQSSRPGQAKIGGGQGVDLDEPVTNISGSGTTGKLPKWQDGPAGVLTDSAIVEVSCPNITCIGVGTTPAPDTPYKFDVRGHNRFSGSNVSFYMSGVGGNEWVFQTVDSDKRFRIFDNSPGSAGERLTIASGGNVGIGTVTPQEKLDVVGNLQVSGNAVVQGNIAAKYQDVAEWVSARESLSAGTVVSLDAKRRNSVVACTRRYDTHVAGVVTKQPGVILGEGGEGKVMVATTGRVKVKVDARRSGIKIGDLLVTSGEPGLAMKSQPIRVGGRLIHRPGTIIGKALEPLAGGRGEILVLLSLQ